MSPISVKVRDLVLARDGGVCVLQLAGCSHWATVADHRANRGAGGSKVLNRPSNLIAACTGCNGAKEDSHGPVRAALVERGVRVVQDSTNAKTAARALAVPVEYPDGSVWWLDDEGGKRGQPF